MVTFPLPTPNTEPVLLTVAIVVLEDVQGLLLAAVPLPVSDNVPN